MDLAILFNARGVQEEEILYPYYRLIEHGLDVSVVGVGEIGKYKGRDVIYGKHGMATPFTNHVNFLPTNEAKNAKVIVIPGGWEAPEVIRQNNDVLDFLRHMNDKGVLICAICHGPWVLISAGICKGKRMTCFVGMKDDLHNAGATYVDAPVVRDGNIITSPHYRNCPDFMREVINYLQPKS